jgi:hypothetical protein
LYDPERKAIHGVMRSAPFPEPSMSDSTLQPNPDLDEILDSRKPGHGLPRAFYQNDALYAHELQRIWYAGWLFAGLHFRDSESR